jgi:hypothetical protein
VEDDKMGDGSSQFITPLASAVRTSFVRLWESGRPGRQPSYSVSADGRPNIRGIL